MDCWTKHNTKNHDHLTFLTKSLKVDIGKVKNLLRKQRDNKLVEKSKQKNENNRGGFQRTGGEIEAKLPEKKKKRKKKKKKIEEDFNCSNSRQHQS